jgi:hypothetical protein
MSCELSCGLSCDLIYMHHSSAVNCTQQVVKICIFRDRLCIYVYRWIQCRNICKNVSLNTPKNWNSERQAWTEGWDGISMKWNGQGSGNL